MTTASTNTVPAFMTGAEYARHRGISRQAVHDAEKRGLVVRNRDRFIDVAATDRMWHDNVEPRDEPAPMADPLAALLGEPEPEPEPEAPKTPAPTSKLNQQKARKTAADAQIAELKLAKLRGELIDIREAKRVRFATLRTLRNRLRAIPARDSALLAQIETEHELRHRLRFLIDEALRIPEDEVRELYESLDVEDEHA